MEELGRDHVVVLIRLERRIYRKSVRGISRDFAEDNIVELEGGAIGRREDDCFAQAF